MPSLDNAARLCGHLKAETTLDFLVKATDFNRVTLPILRREVPLVGERA